MTWKMASMPTRNKAKGDFKVSWTPKKKKIAYIAQSDTCQKREENMSECTILAVLYK